MMRFNATQKLQQAVLTMMATSMATKKELSKLQAVFTQLDSNKDGKLNYEEFFAGLTEQYGYTNEEVDHIFSLMDTGQSGEIDFSEFVTATVSRDKMLSQEKLRRAFNMFDVDKTGKIGAEQIKNVIGVGKNIEESVW